VFRESERYSGLWHTAVSIWLGRVVSAPDRHWFLVLSGYFDDSGSHGEARALVVCGFAASVEKWLEFESRWNAILRDQRFDLEYLHMKEMRSGKGRFAKFKDNLPLQTALYKRLHSLIRETAAASFNTTVLANAYRAVNAEYELEEEFGRPFALCASSMAVRIGRWMAERHPQEHIRLVFDQGTRDWGHMSDTLYRRHGGRPIPEESKQTPPLQAADLAAWEAHRAVTEILSKGFGGGVRFRGAFRSLMEKFGEDDWEIYDESRLRELCLGNGLKKRLLTAAGDGAEESTQ
jgi:hypothetical protein